MGAPSMVGPIAHATSPREIVASGWRHRQLLFQLMVRDVVGRYQGSVMGLAWSLLNPIVVLSVYTFVFSVVFQARWGAGTESRIDFALLLFVGMILHGVLAECINRAPTLILLNANYVKKVIFPLEILSWVTLGSALFHAVVSCVVLLAVQLVINQHLPWTAILFPLVLLPLALGALGLSWLFASLGVYVRDIAQTTGILTTVLLFLSPVFYPISALPVEFQFWMRLNPLTYIMEEGRKTLVLGQMLDWSGWIAALFISGLICWGGFWWFQKTRKGFADVV